MTIRRKLLMSLFSYSFPAEPTSYNLISTYSTSQTWTAPEDGWFQVENFGASGNGGSGQYLVYKTITPNFNYTGSGYGQGGGGGGGGYACSRIKMKKGDTIVIVKGAVGSTSSATINSSLETYSALSVTSGKNGGNGTATASGTSTTMTAGTGGDGGVASGGNYANVNGGKGANGNRTTMVQDGTVTPPSAPNGGTAGYTGGNAGGAGGNAQYAYQGSTKYTITANGGSGSAGFIKIYRGNTNKVA